MHTETALEQIASIVWSGLEPGKYVFIVSNHATRELLFWKVLRHPDLPDYARQQRNRIHNGVAISPELELRFYCLADLPEKLMGQEYRGYFVSDKVKRMAYEDPHVFMIFEFIESRMRGNYGSGSN